MSLCYRIKCRSLHRLDFDTVEQTKKPPKMGYIIFANGKKIITQGDQPPGEPGNILEFENVTWKNPGI